MVSVRNKEGMRSTETPRMRSEWVERPSGKDTERKRRRGEKSRGENEEEGVKYRDKSGLIRSITHTRSCHYCQFWCESFSSVGVSQNRNLFFFYFYLCIYFIFFFTTKPSNPTPVLSITNRPILWPGCWQIC